MKALGWKTRIFKVLFCNWAIFKVFIWLQMVKNGKIFC